MTITAIRAAAAAGAVRAIGLMSGTSHDGISAALVEIDPVEIDPATNPPARLIAFRSYPYAAGLRARLLRAAGGLGVGTAEISTLNFDLGRAFGRAALDISRRASLARVSFIGSHGHTVFHLPPRTAGRGQTPSTLQLGESAVIAAMTGVAVVSDFRPMDIALGGEGAPLAPLAHVWMFGDRKLGRVVQNIGGIANATYLPPRGGRVIAFDTGPGVMLIDALALQLSHGRLRMDRDGKMAARGTVNARLLADLMRDPYFRRRPPKSTGREQFGADYLAQIEARARRLAIRGDDLIATVTALTARSIAEACRKFVIPLGRVDQLIATGGGARNPVLMRMLTEGLQEIEVMTANKLGVDGDALEAVAFAILGYRMLRGEPGNIPSVTGARESAILGKLTLPPS
ncbi:MAG: anhydro-N-acetylmuramic acid kinase [Candidatus Binatales bacterium]